MTRIKPTPMIINDLKGVGGALEEIARIDLRIAEHEAHMNEAIITAKANGKALCDPLQARRKELSDAVTIFATLRKAELFAKRKSMELAHGAIGFRQSSGVVTKAKVKLAQVLERLKDMGWTEAVTTKESVNKEAMRGWPDSKLEAVGMERKVEDTFFIDIDTESVKDKG